VAGLRGHLRDAGAHDAGADHQQGGVRELETHVGSVQFGGRLARNAAKPSRASSVPRTRAMVCCRQFAHLGVTGPDLELREQLLDLALRVRARR
jgi:hypothetical protein